MKFYICQVMYERLFRIQLEQDHIYLSAFDIYLETFLFLI